MQVLVPEDRQKHQVSRRISKNGKRLPVLPVCLSRNQTHKTCKNPKKPYKRAHIYALFYVSKRLSGRIHSRKRPIFRAGFQSKSECPHSPPRDRESHSSGFSASPRAPRMREIRCCRHRIGIGDHRNESRSLYGRGIFSRHLTRHTPSCKNQFSRTFSAQAGTFSRVRSLNKSPKKPLNRSCFSRHESSLHTRRGLGKYE